MLKCFVVVFLSCATVAALGQDAPGTSKPVKVCVAQLRNQSATKFDMSKLRQSFLANLRGMKLVKEGAVALFEIEADNPDDAKPDLQKNECDIAIYARVLQKVKQSSVGGAFDGTDFHVSKSNGTPLETYGLQCTVERTSSGMPILLDRQFDTQPSRDDVGVLKLLAAQTARIEDALAKKLVK